MRKPLLLLTAAIMMACPFESAAQLKVKQNGRVEIGETSAATGSGNASSGGISTNGIGSVVLPAGPSLNPDTLATLYVAGPEYMLSGTRIALGGLGDVSISESAYDVSMPQSRGKLRLNTKNGISIYAGTKNLMYYDPANQHLTAGICMNFGEPLVAPQYLTTSDARAKTDIEPLENMGFLLKDLSPVSYRLKADGSETETSRLRSNSAAGAGSDAHLQYGFLAQEVREIYPDLVYEDSEGNLSLDYTGFIPILVDAIQALQRKVEEQQELIGTLSEMVRPGMQGLRPETMASLSQNRPNPFNASTVISCVVPESAANAFICIYDLNGGQKRRYDIAGRGSVDVTVDGNQLPAGMYIYTLIVDGVEIDSKRMILTD